MNKKYFPFIMLLAVILLFVWIKKNQRGVTKGNHEMVQPAIEDFSRQATRLVYSRHAKCRMECRHIDEEEVKDILAHGDINFNKIEEGEKGKTYPLEGVTRDRQHVRIVFAPHQDEMVVVTVIDLDKEWQCNCN